MKVLHIAIVILAIILQWFCLIIAGQGARSLAIKTSCDKNGYFISGNAKYHCSLDKD